MGSIRDKVLASKDIQSEIVPVPGWDVNVEVRGLTGRQRAKLIQAAVDERGKYDIEKAYPELVIMSTYDPETGEQVFTEEDRVALAEKSGAAIDQIVKVAMRLSGLTATAVTEAVKN